MPTKCALSLWLYISLTSALPKGISKAYKRTVTIILHCTDLVLTQNGFLLLQNSNFSVMMHCTDRSYCHKFAIPLLLCIALTSVSPKMALTTTKSAIPQLLCISLTSVSLKMARNAFLMLYPIAIIHLLSSPLVNVVSKDSKRTNSTTVHWPNLVIT